MPSKNPDVRRLEARGYTWPIPWAAVELIAEKEACRTKAYKCWAGKWTIGWGETMGGQVTQGMVWTEDQCDLMFLTSLSAYVAQVRAQVRENTGPHELGAMASLAYNIGLGDSKDVKKRRGFWWSAVRRLHNEGNEAGAAKAFPAFNRAVNPATGVLEAVDGLTRRRIAEAAIYVIDGDEADLEPMPQVVAPERQISESHEVKSNTAAVTVSTVGAAAAALPELAKVTGQAQEAQTAVSSVKGVVETLQGLSTTLADFIGMPPLTLLLLVGAAFSGYALYRRVQRWRQGS